MFTETPPSGRRVRGKSTAPRQSMGPPQLPTQPQPQQQQPSSRKSSAADHPATPLASVGPPNFSYGSATHALPRQITLADTKMSIFAAMNRAAKDARERDRRAGKVVPDEPEGQTPLLRFYEESIDEIPTGPVSPPKIRALKDEPVRESPRRSTRSGRSTLRDSVDSDIRRTPTPTPSEESEEERSVTHVLVRPSKSPAKPPKRSPAKTRKAPVKKQEPTIDSSNYEFSKDYSEEERAYQELQGRNGAHRAAINIKETHYEDDEDEEDEDEEDEDDEDEEQEDDDEEDGEDQEEKEDDEEEEDLFDDELVDHYMDEEPEDFIIPPRHSIFSPIKNAALFTYFFFHNLVASTFHAFISVITRILELFIYTPLLWIVDSFKSFFRSLNSTATSILTTLGAGSHNETVKKVFASLVTIGFLVLATPPAIRFLNEHHVLDTLTSYRLPHFGATYTPPDLPPGTAEEIVDRLLELERQLSSYSSLSNQVLQQNKVLRQDNQDEKIRRGAIDDSIYLLKQEIEKLNTYAKSSATQLGDLKQFHKDSKESIKDLHTTLLNLDAEMEKHSDTLRKSNIKSDATAGDIKHLKSNIEALKKGLHHVEGELKRIADFDYISNIALKTIEGQLPSQLAVRMHPKTKKVEITPEFWTALRGVFADRQEMEKSVGKQVSKIADSKVVQKEISWGEFLRGNEEAIKGFVKVQMDDRWNRAGEDGVIVSRDYFLEILKDQVSSLRGDMDSKTRQLIEKFEKSSKENIAKAVQSAEAVAKRGRKSTGKDLSTEAMNSIVETALHRYSTDTLAKPDYALYSSGARINPILTSSTYVRAPRNLAKKLGSFLFGGAGSTWGHQPAMALFQDTNVGMCWAFPGDKGGLGIRLSETVLITDVSLEHIHREISKNIGSAPRQWALYAYIPDASARQQIESINDGLYESVSPANLPKGYTLLVRGEYDINDDEGKTIQTVPVPAAIRRLNVPVEQVVFAVGSNWGNSEYTCLYRVRVHGQGLQEDGDADKGFGDDEAV